jgi:DNA-binding transcriptional ArsR family regulator
MAGRTAVDDALAALADPTRRAVVELLRQRPHRAGELADALDMSAPALSRHLRALRQAGLIDDEPAQSSPRRLRPSSRTCRCGSGCCRSRSRCRCCCRAAAALRAGAAGGAACDHAPPAGRRRVPADEGQGAAVTLIQRFRSAGNLNIHLHCLVLDGVYRCGADGAPTFVQTKAPNDDKLHALLQTCRCPAPWTRRGPRRS